MWHIEIIINKHNVDKKQQQQQQQNVIPGLTHYTQLIQ